VIAAGQTVPQAIAVDATSAYWTTSDAVMSCAIEGCTSPATLASAQGPFGLAVDADSVYWANTGGGNVMKLTPK
jgi:hypothetical protein